jgi:hypothetical protein
LLPLLLPLLLLLLLPLLLPQPVQPLLLRLPLLLPLPLLLLECGLTTTCQHPHRHTPTHYCPYLGLQNLCPPQPPQGLLQLRRDHCLPEAIHHWVRRLGIWPDARQPAGRH